MRERTCHADILTHTVPTNTRPRVHAAKHTCSHSQALTWEPRIFWDPRIHRQTFNTHTCVHTHIHTGIEHTQKIHAVPATYCRLENHPKLGGMKQRHLTMLPASVGGGSSLLRCDKSLSWKESKSWRHLHSHVWPLAWDEPHGWCPGPSLSLLRSPGLSMRPL